MTFPSSLRSPALLGLGLLLALAPPAFAATTAAPAPVPTDAPAAAKPDAATSPATADELTPDAIATRRAALQNEIARARADLEQLPAGKQDDTALWLTQEIGLLARLDGLHAEQLRTLQHAADLAKEAAELTALTKNPRPPEVRLPPPRGLPLLDQLYGERDYLLQAKDLLKTDVENASVALDDAREELADRDRLRRTARETVETASDRARAQGALRLAEFESRIAREAVLLAEKALATLKLQQSLIEPKLALLLPDLEWLHAHLVLAEADFAAAQARGDKRLAELDTALAAASEEAERVARLAVLTERRVAGSAAEARPSDDELESRRADRQTVHLMLSALAAQRDRQTAFSEVLQLRRRVLGGEGASAELKAWADANQQELDRLQKSRRPRAAELRKSRQELQSLRNQLADPAAPARGQDWVADRLRHLDAWVAVNERELADLTDLTTARTRLKEELGARVSTFSWSDTLGAIRARLLAAWDYEVFSVSDQPVRVNTILTVIALVLAGHWASRRASDLIGRTVFHRLGLNTGRRAAWQTLSFYALFLIVLLVATNLFHLSLTQFSVVSGALAVGIGFGSQTLIGNFISGIILLLERPVNQGDVIEIDGQQMTVERLGPRSTLVRSCDNTHVIVPNSRLLEENVINWTLSDDIVRTRIDIGVAYGSPTREVERLLVEVLLGLEDVKREPAPIAVFTDFGDSAMMFQASFWSALENRREVAGELRHRIAESFAKAGVQMAFPQRDVHLETTRPLRIEVVPPSSPLAAPASEQTPPAA